MKSPDGYLNLTEASRFLGCHLQTIRRMLDDGRLAEHTTGATRAVRLVAIADLERLRQPTPVSVVSVFAPDQASPGTTTTASAQGTRYLKYRPAEVHDDE